VPSRASRLMAYTLGQRAAGDRRRSRTREHPGMCCKGTGRNALIVSQNARTRLMSRRVAAGPFLLDTRAGDVPMALSARSATAGAAGMPAAELDAGSVEGFRRGAAPAVAGQYLVLYDGEECLGAAKFCMRPRRTADPSHLITDRDAVLSPLQRRSQGGQTQGPNRSTRARAHVRDGRRPPA